MCEQRHDIVSHLSKLDNRAGKDRGRGDGLMFVK